MVHLASPMAMETGTGCTATGTLVGMVAGIATTHGTMYGGASAITAA